MSRSLPSLALGPLALLVSLAPGIAGAQTRGGTCPEVESAFDIDVAAVHARGDFTVNGLDPVPFDAESARLELRSEALGVVDLGSVYLGHYSRWVVPGTYDVVYVYESGNSLPVNAETVLIEDMDFTASGIYDFDIPSVEVSGAITLNGGPPPVSVYEWGRVKLRDVVTGAEFPIGRSYDGAYAAQVIPGVYDVVWSNALGGSWVPANKDAILAEGVVINGATVLDVDVPGVEASGTFKLNGAAPPTSVYENGAVYLRDPQTGDLVDLGDTRDRTWSKVVVPGTYDAVYSVKLGGSIVPANEHAVVDHDLVVTGGPGVQIDIRTVDLQGEFLLDGARFPNSVYDNAKIWLRGVESADVFDIGMTKDQSYGIRVVAGHYDVIYANVLANGSVPANDWAVLSADNPFVKLKGNPPIDFDVEVSSGLLSVDVTIWGEAPTTSIYHNGAILAVDANGDQTLLGHSRDGGGSERVISGTYGVHYAHMIGTLVPLNGDAPVGEATSAPFPLPTPVDLEAGLLGGAFSLNGGAFPASASQVGRLSLRDQETGDLVDLGESTAGAYQENLLGRTYDIVYDYEIGKAVPANEGATVGCVTFAPPPPLQLPGRVVTTR